MAIGAAAPPDRPARPERPVLLPPREMPRRRNFGSPAGRIALLHALAHIELNAIDLAWDIVGRFPAPELPRRFFDDWTEIAAEEAEHFALLAARLEGFGARYGDLPAHDGLWEAAVATRHDLLARLAIVPLVLEARGLDVTPEMADRLYRAGDDDSAGDPRPHLPRRDRPRWGRCPLVQVFVPGRRARSSARVPGLRSRPLQGTLEASFQPRSARESRLSSGILRTAGDRLTSADLVDAFGDWPMPVA